MPGFRAKILGCDFQILGFQKSLKNGSSSGTRDEKHSRALGRMSALKYTVTYQNLLFCRFLS